MFRMMSSECPEDTFRKTFKYYKSKNNPPSFHEVIDIFCKNECMQKFTEVTPTIIPKNNKCSDIGVQDLEQWKMYSLIDNPGVVYIPNPFTTKGQRYWIKMSLQEYPKKPNKTNIDNEKFIEDWWQSCKEDSNRKKYLKKLRWTTLGYHHDWDTKIYMEESQHTFPDDLSQLCKVIAAYCGYDKFRPQAAIVNYYHMDSTLSPHTDHSEKNLEAPLISISFGQSAIFLIGGPDKSQKPTALLLHSGDIVIMSKESRLSYHAVPKIIPAPDTPWEEETPRKHSKQHVDEDVSSSFREFDEYIRDSRININVRQVLEENKNSLND